MSAGNIIKVGTVLLLLFVDDCFRYHIYIRKKNEYLSRLVCLFLREREIINRERTRSILYFEDNRYHK